LPKAPTATLIAVSALKNRSVNLKNSAAGNVGKIAGLKKEVKK
jgi:hypothetical protein